MFYFIVIKVLVVVLTILNVIYYHIAIFARWNVAQCKKLARNHL